MSRHLPPWVTRNADIGDWLVVVVCCAALIAVTVGAFGIGS